MANIMFGSKPISSLVPMMAEWDPIARMREFLHWDPFQEIRRVAVPELPAYTFVPAFEVRETKDSYVFKADLPGIKEQDLAITLTGERLTITGKREAEVQEKGDTWYAYERGYGTFTRSFTLPSGANGEQAKAELKDGVLTLVLPKVPELQSKKIAIRAGEKVKA